MIGGCDMYISVDLVLNMLFYLFFTLFLGLVLILFMLGGRLK